MPCHDAHRRSEGRAFQQTLSAYANHPYVRIIANNGNIFYTEEFYSAMYEKIKGEDMTYVEAYNALGFDTAVLTEARANSAGTRAVKMMEKNDMNGMY